ncbi:hypothetical protein ACFYQA_26595 [Streptomyces sp. NPDC005774]|uniref:hypothetical protein n=1 Tax=Streptomyces sp. NPDC005774 TaxID=3364728 RepID=UPI003673A7FA
MQDHASSLAGSGTALPRVLGALGDPARLGPVRVLSGARCLVVPSRDGLGARSPGPRSSALLSAVVAGHAGGRVGRHVTGTRDED